MQSWLRRSHRLLKGRKTLWSMVCLSVLSYLIFLSLTCHLLVNGVPKPYSQVTEEDHDLMTPDEYTAYFEILQAHS